jgi:hypothetical protein
MRDNIKLHLSEIGCEIGEWVELAQDHICVICYQWCESLASAARGLVCYTQSSFRQTDDTQWKA